MFKEFLIRIGLALHIFRFGANRDGHNLLHNNPAEDPVLHSELDPAHGAD